MTSTRAQESKNVAGVEERIVVAVPPAEVFAAVADVRRMVRWSSELFGAWVWRRENGRPSRFIGFDRRGLHVWFSSCQVRIADPGVEYAFDVTALGCPVARWGYRFTPVEGGTEVTEYWFDQRTRGAKVLGRIFTGKSSNRRPEVNREGMRETLRRLKAELEPGRHG